MRKRHTTDHYHAPAEGGTWEPVAVSHLLHLLRSVSRSLFAAQAMARVTGMANVTRPVAAHPSSIRCLDVELNLV
jgi:hypothetical protein